VGCWDGGWPPDHKTIAGFRRMHRDGRNLLREPKLVRFGALPWAWLEGRVGGLSNGSKFQAVSRREKVYREREGRLERYLETVWSRAMSKTRWSSDASACGQLALGKVTPASGGRKVGFIAHHARPFIPGYNVQAAVRRRTRAES